MQPLHDAVLHTFEEVVTGSCEVASTGGEVPVEGLEIVTEVHTLKPAVWNALTALDPVTPVKVDEMLEVDVLVVVTENATNTDDCSK